MSEQLVYAWGFPIESGMPYISFRTDRPYLVGDCLFYNTTEYEIYEADRVTKENQLQNIYVRPKVD